MKPVVLSLALLSCFVLTLQSPINDLKWEEFKSLYGKRYPSKEIEMDRYKIWKERTAKIEEHNAKNLSYTKRVMHFGDLTAQEVVDHFTGLKITEEYLKNRNTTKITVPGDVEKEIPKSKDWRDEDCVTKVKSQGHCGSCWSFSTTGALECAMKLKTGNLVPLSEQQFVDCDYGNGGCLGGLMVNAFKYAEKGVESEESYPYEGFQGFCMFRSDNAVAKVKSYVEIEDRNEEQLMKAVATRGTISIGVCANDNFQSYDSGVYDDDSCERPDHAVLIIGYNKDYWILKNSWGRDWGNNGYIKMKRNSGLIRTPSYPVV